MRGQDRSRTKRGEEIEGGEGVKKERRRSQENERKERKKKRGWREKREQVKEERWKFHEVYNPKTVFDRD